MNNRNKRAVFVGGILLTGLTFAACNMAPSKVSGEQPDALYLCDTTMVMADIVTDSVPHDTDDPAIWLNPEDPAKSLIVGTDKDENGGLYVFGLDGKMIKEKTVAGLKRPNNVDIEYGLLLNGKTTDIAVVTERFTHKLRIYTLPDMKPVDGGGIDVFAGETQKEYRDLMGISLYKNKSGKIYAIVGRKSGPTDGTYLWQYELKDNGKGQVKATLARKFGKYSGNHEIEAIVTDDAMGFVYYSDEGIGVRKYYADPERGNEELALFGTTGFADDHEGISIYNDSDSTGFILVSDQQAQSFHIFPREGTAKNINNHPLLRVVKVSAKESDGSESIAVPLNDRFPRGLFVAMSSDKTFHFFKPEKILGNLLK
jgi:3-phytase